MRTVRREEEKKNIFVDVDESYMKLVVLLPVLKHFYVFHA